MQSFQEYWKNTCPKLIKPRAKEMYKMYVKGEEEIMNCTAECPPAKKAKAVTNISFSAFTTAPLADMSIWANTVCEQEQEGTTPMNTERDYLNRRVSEVFRTLDRNLEKQFHLGENTSPKSYKDLIDWIKNDKFEIDKKQSKYIELCTEEGGHYHGSFLDGIIWTGAGFKSDSEGYYAAREFLQKAKQEATDVINTSDASDGLKALKEFESWTFKSKKH